MVRSLVEDDGPVFVIGGRLNFILIPVTWRFPEDSTARDVAGFPEVHFQPMFSGAIVDSPCGGEIAVNRGGGAGVRLMAVRAGWLPGGEIDAGGIEDFQLSKSRPVVA